MDIKKVKERDVLLCKEAKLKKLARLVGFSEIGEPVEIIFDPKEETYEWHVGGEYVREASKQSVQSFVPGLQLNAF